MLDDLFRFQPVRSITLPEWADADRRLPHSNSAVPGAWRTERVEAARGPMMSFTEPGVRTITAATCTQLLKSELLLSIVGYCASEDPAPIPLCQPTIAAAKSFSRERVSKMIRETPILRDRFDPRSRVGDDTLYKSFAGGFLAIAPAGSPTNLAMRAIKVTVLDEIDKYETSKEGDPVALAEERTATFGRNAKHVRCCSPTLTETSRIWTSYMDSDQRRAFMQCPHCREWIAPHFFKHVNWPKTDDGDHIASRAAIWCERCGVEWEEKVRMNAVTTKHGIRWQQCRPFTCCEVEQDPRETRRWEWDDKNQVGYALCKECNQRAVPNHHAGFQASKLLSPFITVPELVEKWLVACQSSDTKLTFYNTNLGEPAELDFIKEAANAHVLIHRREHYDVAPEGVVVITMGVDVQTGSEAKAGRLEWTVTGWGLGEESWVLAHEIAHGDVTNRNDPEGPWARLREWLMDSEFPHAVAPMPVRAVCVDCGDGKIMDTVIAFCREFPLSSNVWAIRGRAERGAATWGPIWPAPVSQKSKVHRPYFHIGVNSAKSLLANRLRIEVPGPEYIHFPATLDTGYFEQLTAEQLRVETKGGQKVARWILPRGRNCEALDCWVYSLAALRGWLTRGKNSLERTAAAIEQYKLTGGQNDETEKRNPAATGKARLSQFVNT